MRDLRSRDRHSEQGAAFRALLEASPLPLPGHDPVTAIRLQCEAYPLVLQGQWLEQTAGAVDGLRSVRAGDVLASGSRRARSSWYSTARYNLISSYAAVPTKVWNRFRTPSAGVGCSCRRWQQVQQTCYHWFRECPLNSVHRGALEFQYDKAAAVARSVSPVLVQWVRSMRGARTVINAVPASVMSLLRDRGSGAEQTRYVVQCVLSAQSEFIKRVWPC